jgi:hypothetical protein
LTLRQGKVTTNSEASDQQSGYLDFNVSVGEQDEAFFSANTYFEIDTFDSYSAQSHAVMDPFIDFQPGFEFADQFAITISENVIPEPSTALLLAAGLAGIAAAGRRRTSQGIHQ